MSNEFVQIVKGEEKTIKINLFNEDGSVYDLAGQTGVSVSFQNADKTTLTKSATVVSSDAGKISVTLQEAETALLKEGLRQPCYVTIDKGSVKTIVLTGLDKAISVIAKPF